MAVIEIAKIQVRRGQEQQTGVPPLAGGEFAWAADTENLYIGLRREDGGARDANVRILTENDLRNFFAASQQSNISGIYTYRSGTDITVYNTGTSIFTEYASGEEFGRTLQDRLDDIVVVKNFGVTGDDGDNTQSEYIQLAVDRLFLSTATEFSLTGGIVPPAKVLVFPAGKYSVTGTIFLPPNTTIVGEGIDKTIITLKSDSEHVFQTVDAVGRRDDTLLPGTRGVFTSTGWPAAMQSPSHPKNIHIEGMTIQYEVTDETTLTGGISLLSLDCAENALIRRVKFKGNYDENKIADINYSGIDIRGFGGSDIAVTSEHILIDDCQFEGLYTGVKSGHDVNDVVIQNSYFYLGHHGIAFNTPISPDGYTEDGPVNIKVVNNKFEDIQEQAIFVGENISGKSSNVISQNNTYINVGNYGQGEDWSTGTSIISYLTNGNSSIDDYFERKVWQESNEGYNYNILIDGRASIDYSSTPTVIVDAGFAKTLMKLPITGRPQYIEIKYSCYADLGSSMHVDRQGNAKVFVKEGEDPEVFISDDFTALSSDGALYWGVTVDDGYNYIIVSIYNPPGPEGGTGYPVEVQYQPKIIL